MKTAIKLKRVCAGYYTYTDATQTVWQISNPYELKGEWLVSDERWGADVCATLVEVREMLAAVEVQIAEGRN